MSEYITTLVNSKGDSSMNPIFQAAPILAQAASPLNQNVTISFNVGLALTSVIVGLIAGVLAGILVRGRRFGFIGSVILGILGAVVGNFIFSLLNIQLAPDSALLSVITIRLIDILVAFVGALIILIIYIALFGRRTL
jgi:uncharacterized membrane protein YeaQ/YmgE (transglycosylase-associated protein family)